MPRHEFPSKVKEAAAIRANGHCERCGGKLFTGKIRYDHEIPDALGGKNTLENCCVVCINCDTPKTSQDIKNIAKAKRIFRKHHDIRKTSRFPGARSSKWKIKLDRTVIER